MKRYILVNARVNKDKETNANLLFLTMAKLPSKMKDGGLWHPKKDELILTACINEQNKPQDFKDFSTLNPGTLIDVIFGLNDFTQKVVVESLQVVPGTNMYSNDELYI